MGSPTTEEGRWDIEEQHAVVHTRGFWMAESPVTQAEWTVVCGGSLEEQFRLALDDETPRLIDGQLRSLRDFLAIREGDDYSARGPEDRPMHYVTWDEARRFCDILNTATHRDGELSGDWNIRLPTEAEWEYACRAGTTTGTYAGDLNLSSDPRVSLLDDISWHPGNWPAEEKRSADDARPRARLGPAPVGRKMANPWGLHDMIGNVWEWCLDAEHAYSKRTAIDPVWLDGSRRIPRGGCWYRLPRACRAANRGADDPQLRANFLGFRPVLSPRRIEC